MKISINKVVLYAFLATVSIGAIGFAEEAETRSSKASPIKAITKDPRACPPCPVGPSFIEFCELRVTDLLSASGLCVDHDTQLTGNLTVCGTGHFANSTDSTGCGNGALIVDGGASIGKTLRVCGTGQSTNCTNGSLIVAGAQELQATLMYVAMKPLMAPSPLIIPA